MRTNEFVERLAGYGQFGSTTEARQATRAALLALSETLTDTGSQHLADVLPDDLDKWVMSVKDKPASGISVDCAGFVQRVAERLPGEVSDNDAEQRAHLVLTTLHEALREETWAELVDGLPQDFERVFWPQTASRWPRPRSARTPSTDWTARWTSLTATSPRGSQPRSAGRTWRARS